MTSTAGHTLTSAVAVVMQPSTTTSTAMRIAARSRRVGLVGVMTSASVRRSPVSSVL